MLSPADQRLVQRDPAIRGLATLLDSAAFAATLKRAFPRLQIRAAHCRFLRYKPGLTCLALYQIDCAGGCLELQAEAFAESRQKKIDRALGSARSGGPFGASRVLLAEAAILIFVFPDDPALPALASLDFNRLSRLLPGRPDLAHAAPVRLRYKPQRRYVARLDGGNGSAVLKLYSAAGYDAAMRVAPAFASCPSLAATMPIGQCAEDHALVFPWVEGMELRERLAEPGTNPGELAAAGRAIALVHRQPGNGLPHVSRTAHADGIANLTGSLSLVSPELSLRLGEIAHELAARLLALPQCSNPLHGDFDASQVIIGRAGVTLIDFDRAQLGDPATDLGNFLAYLEYDALHGWIAPARIDHLHDALLAGYESISPGVPDLARVRLDAALGLLKLAPHPFRQRHAAWDEITERIVGRLESLLVPRARMTPARPLLRVPTTARQSARIPTDSG